MGKSCRRTSFMLGAFIMITAYPHAHTTLNCKIAKTFYNDFQQHPPDSLRSQQSKVHSHIVCLLHFRHQIQLPKALMQSFHSSCYVQIAQCNDYMQSHVNSVQESDLSYKIGRVMKIIENFKRSKIINTNPITCIRMLHHLLLLKSSFVCPFFRTGDV